MCVCLESGARKEGVSCVAGEEERASEEGRLEAAADRDARKEDSL